MFGWLEIYVTLLYSLFANRKKHVNIVDVIFVIEVRICIVFQIITQIKIFDIFCVVAGKMKICLYFSKTHLVAFCQNFMSYNFGDFEQK